jgi:SAM-dependent methyltransferase
MPVGTVGNTASKEWWRSFFGPLAGLVMFVPRAARSEREVDIVLRRARVRRGARILDLACGTGRHSLIFARKGFVVVGLDYSASYLREARAAARKAGVDDRIRFVRGDMRGASRHAGRGAFDLAVSLFNSFGYFARRADDAKVAREVFRALKPGGRFVLNTLNEGGVRHRLKTPQNHGHEGPHNVFVVDQVRYDRKRRQTEGQWTIVDARGRRTQIARQRLRQNVYSHAELKAMLRAAGFRIERVWGLLGGTRYTPQSWHQTIVAQKPG